MSKYRAVVVGAGVISASHIRSWQAHPEVEVVAIADINSEAAAARASTFGIPKTYTDYRAMLEAERPDLVSICTWMILHAEQAVAAAQAGAKGVLLEKPFAGSLAEVDRVLAAARENGTRVAIAHQHRFTGLNGAARRLVSEGALGTPTLCYRRSSGGLFNNASHAVDTLRYVLGEPEAVWAVGHVVRNTDRYERHDPIEDACAGIVAFAGGTRLILESDCPEPGLPGASAIHGTEGVLTLDRKEGLRLLNGRNGGWHTVPADTVPESGQAQAAELIGWIEGKLESHRNAAEKSRATVEILVGLYESARTRDVVRFPLPTGPSPLKQMIGAGHLPVRTPGKYDIRIKTA
ncbi:MAG: Gfo/Idh/MocA family oxidoreductase [Kiritimatiellae bacterium]|nr:Gfo/Idh/MocA family oxidoreductase [Kiritimatiellia bacterium]